MPGVRCWRVSRPIGAVGLYVPGGTAVLPSSALMLAVPAAIAGCRTIVLVRDWGSGREGRAVGLELCTQQQPGVCGRSRAALSSASSPTARLPTV